MDVLEDTLVAFRVPAWSGADRSSLVRHGKLFLFDLGVRNALLRRPLDRPLDDERGLLLGDLLELERVDTEVQVFSLRADIIARDVRTDEVVLIENQLEGANLTHLGQLLAYMAGTDAKIIVSGSPRTSPSITDRRSGG